MSCEKMSFATERHAKRALKAIRNQKDTRRKPAKKPDRCYRCPRCDQWHLSSRKPSLKEAP